VGGWGGGYIIIGIAEKNGRPVLPPIGLHTNQLDSIQGELTRLSYRIEPLYMPVIQPYFFQGKPILVLYCPAGDVRPYSAPESLSTAKQSRFQYIRSGSRSIRAQGENLRRLQELSARIPFDDRLHPVAELNDLDLGLIRSFLGEIKSDFFDESVLLPFSELCRLMNIARGSDELLRPVNACLLFFSRKPELFFARAWIECCTPKR
jgi:ATP-dependent DNA helicase RecG